jgi:hypothetical protein
MSTKVAVIAMTLKAMSIVFLALAVICCCQGRLWSRQFGKLTDAYVSLAAVEGEN